MEERINSLERLVKELEAELHTYVSRDYLHMYLEQLLGDLIPLEGYSENSKIVGYTPLNIDRVLRHASRAFVQYNAIDWRNILLAYDDVCKKGNIDPYIAVAQMLKETDWLRSWWSARPRRNPAGIGVTGETSLEKPAQIKEWSLKNDGIWIKGYSFPSWEVSAAAHIGHLLSYIYVDEALTNEQRLLTAIDPRRNKITTRGEVKTLKDLDNKWTTTQGYGRSIATLANAIKQ